MGHRGLMSAPFRTFRTPTADGCGDCGTSRLPHFRTPGAEWCGRCGNGFGMRGATRAHTPAGTRPPSRVISPGKAGGITLRGVISKLRVGAREADCGAPSPWRWSQLDQAWARRKPAAWRARLPSCGGGSPAVMPVPAVIKAAVIVAVVIVSVPIAAMPPVMAISAAVVVSTMVAVTVVAMAAVILGIGRGGEANASGQEAGSGKQADDLHNGSYRPVIGLPAEYDVAGQWPLNPSVSLQKAFWSRALRCLRHEQQRTAMGVRA